MTDVRGSVWAAGTLLYGEDVAAALAARVADPLTQAALRRRVGAVGSGALDAVERDIAGVAASFLDVDVVSVLLTGWNKHRELLAAAARTLRPAPATPQEQVTLLSHDIVLTQHPSIDLLVNGKTVLTIGFELAVTITVDTLEAVVRRGRLVDLGAGDCTVKVVFSVQGVDLGAVEFPVMVSVFVPLGDGIPLGPQPAEHGHQAQRPSSAQRSKA